tara:strand:- start:658 stop:2250 length:1593 start_codon:yes stop_codon:yes gene_type:complete
MKYKILSLFSNVGFGEHYFRENGFEVVVANELEEDRASLYREFHPETEMITGDITSQSIKDSIVSACEKHGPIDVIVATPPCQGFSLANASKKKANDPRNTLIIHAMEIFNLINPEFMLIENVTAFAKSVIKHKDYIDDENPDGQINVLDFINDQTPDGFCCDSEILNGKDFGTPQCRKRSITLISKDCNWKFPPRQEETTLRDCIGKEDLFPSFESSDGSTSIPWHFTTTNNSSHVDWMKHTPTGKSAYFNIGSHYPSDEILNPLGSGSPRVEYINMTNGDEGWHTNKPILIDKDGSVTDCPFTKVNDDGKEKLKVEIPEGSTLKREIYGFTTTYKRMNWDKPAPTVTMTNGSISSQNNVHPGRDNGDGTYSNARVLSIRETLAICGLPPDLLDKFSHSSIDAQKNQKVIGNFAYDYSPTFIRKVLGELFLPKMALAILQTLPKASVNQSPNEILEGHELNESYFADLDKIICKLEACKKENNLLRKENAELKNKIKAQASQSDVLSSLKQRTDRLRQLDFDFNGTIQT